MGRGAISLDKDDDDDDDDNYDNDGAGVQPSRLLFFHPPKRLPCPKAAAVWIREPCKLPARCGTILAQFTEPPFMTSVSK